MRQVSVTLPRDTWLAVAGWMNAFRPPGDWEPLFVTATLQAIQEAVKEDSDE